MDHQLEIEIPYDLPRNDYHRDVLRSYLNSRKPYVEKTTTFSKIKAGGEVNLKVLIFTRHGQVHLAATYWKRILQLLWETGIVPTENSVQLAGAYVHKSDRPRILITLSLNHAQAKSHSGHPSAPR